MKLLVTGSGGFIGKNLCAHLRNKGYTDLLEYEAASEPELLDQYAAECDFVFHLAGINRPENIENFENNYTFTNELLQSLKKHGNKAPILFSSSYQAKLTNLYGQSKKRAENILFDYGVEQKVEVFVYRLPGVFGKWCRPHYNSVVATFCDAIAKGQPVKVDDADAQVNLVHIDDVMEEFINALNHQANKTGNFCEVKNVHQIKVIDLKNLITSFRESRNNLGVANMSDPLTYKLYSTYISYLPEDSFSYPLAAHTDQRGSFVEFMKSQSGGQVSINIIKPGATKGNHWHHTKTEKMIVLSGAGVIHFRQIVGEKFFEYPLSADKPTAVDIPAGYVHSITNTGTSEMIVLIWVNKNFDSQNPDTYYVEL